jgi:hypothetical protein
MHRIVIIPQILVKPDVDGKTLSISKTMFLKQLNTLLLRSHQDQPIDVFIAPDDPMQEGPPHRQPSSPTSSSRTASPSCLIIMQSWSKPSNSLAGTACRAMVPAAASRLLHRKRSLQRSEQIHL